MWIHSDAHNEINTSPYSIVTLIKQTFCFYSAVLSNLIHCSKACHHSDGRLVLSCQKLISKFNSWKHTNRKECRASCLWQTAEKTRLCSLLRLVHFCPRDGSNPRVYYQTSDAKPIRFLTPKRAKKMNRGLDKLASLTQAQWEGILKCRSLSSFSSPPALFRLHLITIQFFFLPFTVHSVEYMFYSTSQCTDTFTANHYATTVFPSGSCNMILFY